ncbi:hypothetical protein N5D61_02980 [Pseudomonas sp. GD03842]|uniref:hypothetical protein n=1 Tax=Pseudomonas sp. GD03842 TaxID=2975385 RepID=UPI0024469636|nr:hypothetical protein [Pseudomonas sp. GD03842]MDH0745308.1 hypothetical protein [Pseudomonas sp. GD03842]
MTPDHIAMPAAIRKELDHLLSTINRSPDSDELDRAGNRAENFLLGIERAKALQPALIETSYLLVEQAVAARSGEVQAQSPQKQL